MVVDLAGHGLERRDDLDRVEVGPIVVLRKGNAANTKTHEPIPSRSRSAERSPNVSSSPDLAPFRQSVARQSGVRETGGSAVDDVVAS